MRPCGTVLSVDPEIIPGGQPWPEPPALDPDPRPAPGPDEIEVDSAEGWGRAA